jgi:hypothetical protein
MFGLKSGCLLLLLVALTLTGCPEGENNSSTVNFFGPVTLYGCAVFILPGGATIDAGSVTDTGNGTVSTGGKSFTVAPDCSLRPVVVVPPVVVAP